MNQNIEAIFIDTGNTMRVVKQDAVAQARAKQEIARLLGSKETPESLCALLEKRYAAYKTAVKQTLVQASETELWTRWMLPERSNAELAPLAGQLTRLWLEQSGRRVPRPKLKEVVAELKARGYTLGIIANSISQTEIPEWLEADGLAAYFKVVLMSSTFGRRKPDPYIYIEAARRAGVEPARCAYVGDNPNRDIQGAREAGYGMVVILLEQETLKKDPLHSQTKPDGIIGNFDGLLNLFYPRN
jgi:putative hydrolase of the HAD superfamily